MSQQLNLLSADLLRQRQRWTLQQGLWLLLALIVAGGIGTLVLQFLTRQATADLQQLQQAMDQQRIELTNRQGAAQAGPAGRIDAELRQLRQREAAERRLLEVLAGGQAGRENGHAAVLQALARQADPAVWITGLSLGQDGDTMELQGRMADAAALPAYLRRLQNETLFHGRQFAQLSLQRVEAGAEGNLASSAYTEFVLRTQLGPIGTGAGANLVGRTP
jgi:Tfp pilus assembly protein PilN